MLAPSARCPHAAEPDFRTFAGGVGAFTVARLPPHPYQYHMEPVGGLARSNSRYQMNCDETLNTDPAGGALSRLYFGPRGTFHARDKFRHEIYLLHTSTHVPARWQDDYSSQDKECWSTAHDPTAAWFARCMHDKRCDFQTSRELEMTRKLSHGTLTEL
jgi:hypothetical protein